MKLAVAIHVQDRIDLVFKTLQSVFAGIPAAFELTILADGVTIPDYVWEGKYFPLDIQHSAEPLGAPASLNTWVANCSNTVTHFLFLENGLLLGHKCVQQLCEALDSSPAIGLAGPSTNLCWNEQQIHWPSHGELDHVHVAAEQIAWRFPKELRRLAPLYSLAPFCLAFKRALVEAIGGAYTGYGLGPCWEMDFHIRAERAGLSGVWVQGAYAWRSHASQQQRQREAAYFEVNKRLYQDRLCALKLRNQTDGYEAHCKGDHCEHFAPTELIPLHAKLPRRSQRPNRHQLREADLPCITCIMPTAHRPDYVAQAIHYFLRQDYPVKELVIVYDQESDLPADRPEDPSLRYHQMPSLQSIGNKRNVALHLAQGEIIAMWDDDDWFHPSRLRRQVLPILLGLADVTGLQYTTIYSVDDARFWNLGVTLFHRMFRGQVHGGSIAYRKSLVDRGVYYPDLSLCEDAIFLERAMAMGARLYKMPAQGIYVYVRHGKNTWRFSEGQYLQPGDWLQVHGQDYFLPDQPFYLHKAGRSEALDAQPTMPLVSCIMPTANRAQFIPAAIAHFLRQDYPNKELIIIDDGGQSVQHLIPQDTQIQYQYLAQRHTIGAKRNLACQVARGEVIVHWDDDDWIAPTWISAQLACLQGSGADITGMTAVRFFDPLHRQAWRYEYPEANPAWVCGGTLCYRKSFWARNPFPDIDIGEDNAFVWNAIDKVIVPHRHEHLYAARVHTGNTSAKITNGAWWKQLPFEVIEQMMVVNMQNV